MSNTIRIKTVLTFEYKTASLVAFHSDTFGSMFINREHWDDLGEPQHLSLDVLAGNHHDNIYSRETQ